MPIEFIEWLCSEVLRLLVGTGAERAKKSMGFLPGSLCEKNTSDQPAFQIGKALLLVLIAVVAGLLKLHFIICFVSLFFKERS